MSQPIELGGRPSEQAERTVGRIYLRAERVGKRDVLRWRTGVEWESTPSWRFSRQVIRAALFLRDRLHVAPGDRVLVASALRPERVVAEWAIATLGAVVVYLAPPFAASPHRAKPRAAFASSAHLRDCQEAGAEAVVTFDGTDGAGSRRTWGEVLDLGGTLDTAERARTFRVGAEQIEPGASLLEAAGGQVWTHRDLVRRLQEFWSRFPPSRGDVAYLSATERPSLFCLPAWAFVADGMTSTVFGMGGREADEITEIRPNLLVGSPSLRQFARRERRRDARELALDALESIPVVSGLFASRLPVRPHTIRDAITFDGARS